MKTYKVHELNIRPVHYNEFNCPKCGELINDKNLTIFPDNMNCSHCNIKIRLVLFQSKIDSAGKMIFINK